MVAWAAERHFWRGVLGAGCRCLAATVAVSSMARLCLAAALQMSYQRKGDPYIPVDHHFKKREQLSSPFDQVWAAG